MSEVIKAIKERRAKVWEQMKALADTASNENRNFTGEEEGTWQALEAELGKLDQRAAAIAEGEQRAADVEASFARLAGKPVERQQGGEGAGTELRQFLSGQGGRVYDVKPNGPVDFRDLSKLTAGAGGNTVQTAFYNRLVAHLIEVAGMVRGGATVLTTGSGENIQIPKTTAHSTATLTAEAAAIAESDPVFGQVTLGAFKYGVIVQVSRELVEDASVDLEGYLAMQTGRALGNALGAHLVTGTGAAQPRGITIDTTLGVTSGTGAAGAPTGDNLIDLYYSVIEPYRMSDACKWAMRDATVGAIRKLKGTDGQYLWQPGLQVNEADRLLGKEIVRDPNFAAVALNAKSIIFGDLSQYFVRLAGGIRFERSDEFAFNQDLVTFKATLRGDGALIDLTGAVKHFVGAAT